MHAILPTKPASAAPSTLLGAAARNALQWRLLLLWAVLLLLPTLAATLPIWQMLGASLDQSIHAAHGVKLVAKRLQRLAKSTAVGPGFFAYHGQ